MTQKPGGNAPMPPSAAPSPRPPLQSLPLPRSRGSGLVRFMLMLGGQSVILAALLGGAQVLAPDAYKPATLVGTAIGTVEAEAAKAQMDEQADFERAVAQARAEGERDAELAYQEQIKALDYQYQSQLQVLQGQVTSSIAAYQNLYDRATQIQQVAMSLEGYVMQQRSEAVRGTQVGRTILANVLDVACAFDRQSCNAADDLRYELIDEVNEASQTGYGTILRQTMQGIPDPATLKAQLGNP